MLEANLEALHLEKEAAAANAKAEIREAAVEQDGEELYIQKTQPILAQSTSKYTNECVSDQVMRLTQQPMPAVSSTHEHKSEHSIQLTPLPTVKQEPSQRVVIVMFCQYSFRLWPYSQRGARSVVKVAWQGVLCLCETH